MASLQEKIEAFRHFFTHAYGFDLDPQRMAPLVREVRPVFASFKKEAKEFVRLQAMKRSPSKVPTALRARC